MKSARDLLSHNLKQIRDARRMTQAELAAKARVSLKMVQKVEYGQTNPSLETLDAFAKALGCGIADFYALTDLISAEDLGTAVRGLVAAGPVTRAYVLFLVTLDKSYLERLTPQQRQALAALPLPS